MKKIEYSFFAKHSNLKKLAKTNLINSWGTARFGVFIVGFLPYCLLTILSMFQYGSYNFATIMNNFQNRGMSMQALDKLALKFAWLPGQKTQIVLWCLIGIVILLKIILNYGSTLYYVNLANDIDSKKSCFFVGFKSIIKILTLQAKKSIFLLIGIAGFITYSQLIKNPEPTQFEDTLMIIILAVSLLAILLSFFRASKTSMVFRIMAEEENKPKKDKKSTKEILALSKKLTHSRRFNYIGLNLSYIGWDLLSVLTLGLLSWLYVIPYRETTKAFFYKDLL